MSRIFTLGTLVTRAQELTDLEASGNITTTTWKSFLSTQNGELHGTVAATGYRYFETPQTVVADGANCFFALPADHFASTTVTRVVNVTDRRPLRRVSAQDMARMVHAAGSGAVGSEAVYWALVGQQIWLGPQIPPSGQSYEHRYIPNAPDLTAAVDGTSVDVVTPDGEGFLLMGVAVRAFMKQEKDPRDFIREREAARARLQDWASQRAYHEAHRPVVDDGQVWYLEDGSYRDRSGSW